MIANAIEVFVIFLRLGLTSFGGPVAHLGYFHNEFVQKRKWFDERSYVDLVALCQFLPGPASSQVGIAIGLSRAGVLGAISAWVGFTLPSAILLITFAICLSSFSTYNSQGWLHGLKIAAVAVVAQALWGMAVKLCPDTKRATIATAGAAVALIFSNPLGQLAVIAFGGLCGWFFVREEPELPHLPIKVNLGTKSGFAYLVLLATCLIFLPLLAARSDSQSLKLFDSFFRAGSLVFGGGHVVLPLLKTAVVNPGWVSSDTFMAGYGAAQALPGPLFTFSAYLGAVSKVSPSGILGALICLIGAFLPSFLLVFGALPFWEKLRRIQSMRIVMSGINASVVGLLLAAFYSPVWTSSILAAKDFAVALLLFLLLAFWNWRSWMVVALSTVIGGLFL